jgi:hypothetical protein
MPYHQDPISPTSSISIIPKQEHSGNSIQTVRFMTNYTIRHILILNCNAVTVFMGV